MKKLKMTKVISWILIVALSHTIVSASEVKATTIAAGAGIGGAVAGPPGAVVGAVVGGAIVIGAGITAGVIIAEHTNNKRPSTKNKHQEGEATKQRNKFGGEKGDANRKPNPNKRNK